MIILPDRRQLGSTRADNEMLTPRSHEEARTFRRKGMLIAIRQADHSGGGMQIATPLTGSSQKSDPQALKQWAAEDFAISVGLLRECPYHGQPYKPSPKGLSTQALAARHIDPLDPAVQIFKGDTEQLLAAVERVVRDYGDRCVFCAASDQEEEFD